MKFLVVSLYVSKKELFLHFSDNVDQVYCCRLASRIRNTPYIFTCREKSFLKHDVIPTIFPASGKSKNVPERRDEPKGAFA